MPKDAGVLVVGASVAGLCAAEVAARNGADTLLIEAAPEIGARANPANLIMEPAWSRTGLPVPEDTVERRLGGLRVGGPSGRGLRFDFKVFFVDRSAFDRRFAERAREAGARTRGGVSVTGVHPEGGVYTEDGELRAEITIFADGANSRAGTVLKTMKNPHEVALGVDQLLEAPAIGERETFEVRFGSFAPGWRAQLNPLGGDRARLWTFATLPHKDQLDAYAAKARRAFGLEEARILDERRGADPFLVAPGEISGDGLLVCGAAAAQGGLEYGAQSGLLAGRIAAEALHAGDTSRRSLIGYERAWRRKTIVEHYAVRSGMELVRRMPDAELEKLFGNLDGLAFDGAELSAMLEGNPAPLRRVGLTRAARTIARALSALRHPRIG